MIAGLVLGFWFGLLLGIYLGWGAGRKHWRKLAGKMLLDQAKEFKEKEKVQRHD